MTISPMILGIPGRRKLPLDIAIAIPDEGNEIKTQYPLFYPLLPFLYATQTLPYSIKRDVGCIIKEAIITIILSVSMKSYVTAATDF